jgi:hypothetical protein
MNIYFQRQPGFVRRRLFLLPARRSPISHSKNRPEVVWRKFARFHSQGRVATQVLDLNPLNLSIWGYMLAQLKNYKYRTLNGFKDDILKI